jgi:hypothetical protein
MSCACSNSTVTTSNLAGLINSKEYDWQFCVLRCGVQSLLSCSVCNSLNHPFQYEYKGQNTEGMKKSAKKKKKDKDSDNEEENLEEVTEKENTNRTEDEK